MEGTKGTDRNSTRGAKIRPQIEVGGQRGPRAVDPEGGNRVTEGSGHLMLCTRECFNLAKVLGLAKKKRGGGSWAQPGRKVGL